MTGIPPGDSTGAIRRLADTAGRLRDDEQFERAAEAYGRVVDALRDSLGAGHADTVDAWRRWAECLGSSGDFAGAAREHQARADFLCQAEGYGPEHREAIRSLGEAAHWLRKDGRHPEAAAAYRQLLDARRKVLGPEHPSTVTAWFWLAECLGEAEYPGAAAREHQARAGFMAGSEHWGPDHHATLVGRVQAASWLRYLRQYPEAAQGFGRVLEDSRRVLGPDHPDTLETWFRWADCLGRAGDPDAAAREHQSRADRLAQSPDHGPDHHETRRSAKEAAYWQAVAARQRPRYFT